VWARFAEDVVRPAIRLASSLKFALKCKGGVFFETAIPRLGLQIFHRQLVCGAQFA
jgi:hypothetical protein